MTQEWRLRTKEDGADDKSDQMVNAVYSNDECGDNMQLATNTEHQINM